MIFSGCGPGRADGSSSEVEAANCWQVSSDGEIRLQEGGEVARSGWEVNVPKSSFAETISNSYRKKQNINC